MKSKYIKYLLTGLLTLVANITPAFSQIYRLDVGVSGGISFYMGDANPSKPFHRSQPAFGAQIRRSINSRYAIKAHFMQGKVEGDTRDFANQFPQDQYATFAKNIWDLGVQIEFNFLNYGLPVEFHESSRISPYIFAGFGLVGITEADIAGSTIKANFPFGFGIKYKVLPRVNLIAAWSMHKLFTDDFDTAKGNNLLDDPYNFGKQGSGKNADWYSFAMLSLTFDLFPDKFCR